MSTIISTDVADRIQSLTLDYAAGLDAPLRGVLGVARSRLADAAGVPMAWLNPEGMVVRGVQMMPWSGSARYTFRWRPAEHSWLDAHGVLREHREPVTRDTLIHVRQYVAKPGESPPPGVWVPIDSLPADDVTLEVVGRDVERHRWVMGAAG